MINDEVNMTEEQRKEYAQRGFTVVPNFLDGGQLKILLAEIDRICGDNTLAVHDKTRLEMEPNQQPDGRLVRRIYQPCSYYPLFRELSDSPGLLDAVEMLLGSDLALHYSKINMKPPAIGSVVEWHQDLTYYPLSNDSSIAVLIYLDDADVTNGCLQVIPSHHKGSILNHTRNGYFVGKVVDRVDESDAIPLEGKAGTAIFMHCLTPHASITNTSDRPRRTLILSYRAADAFPIYVGEATPEAEAHVRLVRGKASHSARFSFPSFPIPRQKQKTASLYELQEISREKLA
jgi:ectoine hydroxylase-related dioxygenase (phytanoyl-CoA dioxygenase family)